METVSEKKVETPRELNNFKYFWKFMANNETFVVPVDHEMFFNGVMDEVLLKDILKGKQNSVLNFDFTEKELLQEYLKKLQDDTMKEIYRQNGEFYETEEDKLKREYQYYIPNREFSGRRENTKLKKVDDGTFIDNGYR